MTKPILTAAFAVLLAGPAAAAPIDVYILAGQSNMSGRAPLEGLRPFAHAADIVMDRNGAWVPAREPVSDEPEAALGPSMAFADAMLDRHAGRIGLVPCARGGTKIVQWQESKERTSLFRQCIDRVRATRGGRIAGLLWYQGEYDTWTMADVDAWPKRFRALMAAFRKELGMPGLPIVFTQIGPRPTPEDATLSRLIDLQGHITIPATAVVSATDLPFQADGLHLTQAGQLALGKRYADAVLRLSSH